MRSTNRRVWKKLFLLILVLLFLLPGCGQKKAEMVTVHCLKEIDYGTSKQEYMYDAAGNVLEYYHYDSGRTVCTYDENNNTLQSDNYASDTLIESTVFTYDENGKMLTKTVTDNYSTYEYAYTYNEKGTLIQSVQANYYGNIFAGKYIENFDAEGKPLVWEYYSDSDDTPSSKTEWIYNSDGQCLTETKYQNGELLTRKLYAYDSSGNLLEERDDPQVKKDFIERIEYSYDRKGNKLSCKEYFSFKENPEMLRNHYTYSYDNKGNLLEEQLLNKEGRIILSTTYTYDKAGNMRSKTHKPSKDHTQISTYDEQGNLISYEWSHNNGAAKITYRYITFQLPRHLAEKVRLQQKAVFEALEQDMIEG